MEDKNVSENSEPKNLSKARKEAEETKERALTANQEAIRMREAEATAKKALDEAIERLDVSAENVKHALENEATSKEENKSAQEKTLKAIVGLKNAIKIEEKTKRQFEQATKKLEAEEAKLAKRDPQKVKTEKEIAALENVKRELAEAEEGFQKATEESNKLREDEAICKKEEEETNNRLITAAAEIDNAKKTESAAQKEYEIAKDNAKKAALEAKRATVEEEKANHQAERAANKLEACENKETKVKIERQPNEPETQAEPEMKETTQFSTSQEGSEIFSGTITLQLVKPVNSKQIRIFEDYLKGVEELKLLSTYGSISEGPKIIISTEKPIPLVNILKTLTPVDQLSKKHGNIEVLLR